MPDFKLAASRAALGGRYLNRLAKRRLRQADREAFEADKSEAIAQSIAREFSEFVLNIAKSLDIEDLPDEHLPDKIQAKIADLNLPSFVPRKWLLEMREDRDLWRKMHTEADMPVLVACRLCGQRVPYPSVLSSSPICTSCARSAFEALEDLWNEQNGPPLEAARHKSAWQKAMSQAEDVLKPWLYRRYRALSASVEGVDKMTGNQ